MGSIMGTTSSQREDGEIKVDKWDGNGLKNAMDDAVRKVFTEDLKYSEKNIYVDIRLLLSTMGCAVSLYALLYDYLNPFPKSKMVLIVCVLSYFILMSILTLFMTFIEKNIILLATQKEAAGLDPDSQWKIQTTMKKYDHNYTIDISKIDGTTKLISKGSVTRCISNWVDEDGVVLVDKLKANILGIHKQLNIDGKKSQ